MKITATLCLLVDNSRVLLAMKKRGFGTGRWNGIGGKVVPPESIRATALRELSEEIGVTTTEAELQSIGFITFFFEGKDEEREVQIFLVKNWKEIPEESEEMKPQWFPIEEVPYDSMWPADGLWMPQVLAGRKVSGTVHFDNAGNRVLRTDLKF